MVTAARGHLYRRSGVGDPPPEAVCASCAEASINGGDTRGGRSARAL